MHEWFAVRCVFQWNEAGGRPYEERLTMWRAAEMAVEYVHQLTVDVEIPSMQELGFSEDEIPMLADKAFNDPQTIGNPRDVTAADYRKIYQQAFSLGARG